MKIDEYDKVFAINVRAVVMLTQACLPMIKAAKGNILNVTTTMTTNPIATMANYAASKAAVYTMTRAWAKELAKDGVRVNSLGVSRSDFETVQRILENAPVRRPNGDGEIHPLSGLLFCKDCGAKMHIRIDYRNGGKRHVAFCSEYHKGKAKNPKCHSPHIMDADLLMQTIAEVLKKIEDYSISNRAEFEALVKKNLAMQQTDQTKKQQKRIPQITTRLEQIDKVLNKLYEDNALGTIPQDRYEQMSQKYSEEYYTLKAEIATLQEQLSAYENAGGRAQKFLKLTERHAAFTELTPAILNEFISRIEVHERDQKRARYAIQHISIYFNYIGKFENEVTQLAEPTEQEIRQMREEIEEAKKEKSRAYHRQYSREYRARNLEKQREYDRMKAREYRARRKAQAAAQPAQ